MGAQTFGEFLLGSGKISETALNRAARLERETGQSLSDVLTKLGLISHPDLADGFAAYFGLEKLDADDLPEAPLAIPGLSRTFLRARRILPVSQDDDALTLAMANPGDDFAAEAMAFASDLPVVRRVATVRDMDEAIERLYFDDGTDGEAQTAEIVAETATDDIERLKELASDAPVITYVDRLIEDAVASGASDIHFEPAEHDLRVRFRIDGMLQDMTPPAPDMRAAILSRVKIMAALDIAERRLPQDGRIKMALQGKSFDLRVSTTPTAHGESIVLRILDRGFLPEDFSALGFGPEVTAPLSRAIAKPDGIVLVTGPTGSGKTTTLYAALKQLNAPEKKVLTVEDPIEYMIEGINQVQVAPKIGRTFAATLRSFLRQDPDIMMVGEIRDRETAEIAVEASLTGHLVLTTLHTNNAATALTRLLDMGVEDYLISSTVTLVIGQRLVRTLCPRCRRPYTPDAPQLESLSHGLELSQATFYRPAGCADCNGRGYAGRTGIVEVLEMTDAIRALVQGRAEASEIERQALAQGMRRMFDYGLALAARGGTTVEEVLRVTRDV